MKNTNRNKEQSYGLNKHASFIKSYLATTVIKQIDNVCMEFVKHLLIHSSLYYVATYQKKQHLNLSNSMLTKFMNGSETHQNHLTSSKVSIRKNNIDAKSMIQMGKQQYITGYLNFSALHESYNFHKKRLSLQYESSSLLLSPAMY